MSWLQSLYETYETCFGHESDGSSLLMPIAHTTQQAHVEIVLDSHGSFLRASVLDKERSTTLIPCTESSGGRAGSKPTSHPLCDKLQYVAADYVAHGGEVTSGFSKDPSEPHRIYLDLLSGWASSSQGHPKLSAILQYIKQGRVIEDLVAFRILPVDADGKLLKQWTGSEDQSPAIYKVLAAGQSPEDAFIRWSVEGEEEAAGTWQDPSLLNSWIAYYAQIQTLRGYCMVHGQETTLALQHPSKLRNAGDKAKLISANDDTGFTYRGRFIEADQAVGVGYEATQKAHNALRWLIERQGSRSGIQVIVSWTVAGKSVPDPMKDSHDEFGPEEPGIDTSAGQIFALQLKRAINGYRQTLDPTDDVHVMALDSATPGRMSITFYRQLRNSEFLDRIENWHLRFAWPQNYGKDRQFIGAPSPRDIAKAAFGSNAQKLEAPTRERLLPCIVDQLPVPFDLVDSTCRRVATRINIDKSDKWEWEKNLGIACALFKGIHPERNYQMALEIARTSRDYLYGRLLALAENIEGYALRLAEEGRETNAARLMQRFADRPFSTWRNIELSLTPYKIRLRNRAPAFLDRREQQLDEVQMSFAHEDFTNDGPLSGEFLLGYHCQRSVLRQKKTDTETIAEEQAN
ncbi:type I-C CRISPR-associated protein Cas8c/Csd1 [Paracidovorax anthurii]|uniref:CRISPR-associated Csd1 family protein n=1 Tax=Paracidovorax anthurii TaxID=78229 RepID=A0A328Z7P0_9BURK|nr:type I-C CRISPR-associated protein Cas8c/Csd1 [Paracidovorax anthurii]RAR82230.1 CRISPR-associated Csd1 family protein [Paracidovorax anthurii]